MYDLNREEDSDSIRVRKPIQRPGIIESWWMLFLISGTAGGLTSLFLGSLLHSLNPDFPTLLVTLPVCIALGIAIGRIWGKHRRTKIIQRTKHLKD